MTPRLLTIALCTVLLAGLPACSGKVRTVAKTSEAVTVQYPPDRRSAAEQVAQTTCREYGKAAQLRTRHDQHATMEQVAIYDCITR